MRHYSGHYSGRILTVAALVATAFASPVMAQSVVEEVVVSANRQEQQAFDAPAAINSVGAETLSVAGPQVNVSEVLSRIPGISASNRNNYAQDPQISIRGFGARAAFGVRGIKLVTDGIPASIPDGQGQASTFALTSTDRIEVLRGPLAVLYGNSSGGVIQAFTRKASETPELSLLGYTGSYGLRREDVQFSTTSGKAGLLGDFSRFETDGYRVNSAAKRTQFNGKYDLKQSAKTQLSFILNLWDQPYAEDPAGLQESDLASDRRRIRNPAEHRVRKITSQEQLGATIRHEDSAARQWEGRVYAGKRENLQYQSIFNTETGAWNNSWVGLDRDYYGLGLSASHNMKINDVSFRITGGLEADYSEERRQGGGATNGEKNSANPTRNEDNIAESKSAFLLGTFFVSERYTVTAGTRFGEVEFRSKDLISPTAINRDGSGKVRYSQASPVIGVTRHMSQTVNIFANYGRGVETPTLAEVAYASRSSGTPDTVFNPTIRASKSDQAEAGLKWRPGRAQSLSATVFWVSTEDEIVTDQNAFGRSSFKNAPKTKRTGAEFSWSREWSVQWRSLVTATMIDATYETAFSTNAGAVTQGKKIPGIPAHIAFAEIEWAQARSSRSQPQGFSAAIEAQAVGKRYSDDRNTPSRTADAFETVALRSGYSRTVGSTDLRVFARIDNLLDEKYVGSVIVNNASPFEPSPERNWMVGVKAVTRF